MGMKLAGIGLLCVALAIVAFVLYRNSAKSNLPLIFTPTQVLGATWDTYKAAYVSTSTGRTMDPGRDDDTTSEGESYTMLRAVWMGDKTTFDSSWQFTKNNLEHQNDALFSWLYGQQPGGTYGVLTAQGGDTSASDADSDIALSLIFAYARWQDPSYLSAAKAIVSSIWQHEVVEVAGTPYLVADDKESASTGSVLIDPSYLSPYSYRLFAMIDPAHPWNELVDSSYALLQKSITTPLGGAADALPPDWIALNTETGALSAPSDPSLDTEYGYDALRVPWRIALDWQWNHDPRAQALLEQMSALGSAWRQTGELDTVYSHAGVATGTYQSPAMYGGAIGYFLVADPGDAQAVYTDKLAYLYNPNDNTWKEPLSYYDDNWVWFGIALYNGLLPNLAADLPARAFAISNN